jgi:hypothetical protein
LNIWQPELIAVILLMGTSLALLLIEDWRRGVIVIAIQYLAVFWMVSQVWPLGLAAVKLVVGWMSGAVLATSQPESELIDNNLKSPPARLFRIVAAVIVWVLAFSIAPGLAAWIPVNDIILWGGLVLIGMGLLHLGMSTRSLRVVIGLLTILAGFEIIYAAVENSVLVTGMLTVINLGIAFIGAYLMSVTAGEES